MRRWIKAIRVAGCCIVLSGILIAGTTSGVTQAAAACGSEARNGAEVAKLQRQIAANRVFAARHQCTASSSFACREIAGRIASAQARLSTVSAKARSCTPVTVAAKQAEAPKRQTRSKKAGSYTAAAKTETRCVRPSDGYNFPTPNSGFSTADDMDRVAAQCRFICDDASMQVYKLTGSGNSEDMTSIATGEPYSALPSAGAYRKTASLQRCDINRFYKTVMAMSLRPASNELVASITKSPERPVQLAFLDEISLRGPSYFEASATREVRLVGTAFLPVN